jgi:diguanylate cyclase (GGDEF)-like protein
MTERLNEALINLGVCYDQSNTALRKLLVVVMNDQLTPLLNGFALAQMASTGVCTNYVIVYGDIDNFKDYNSNYTHAGGDSAIFQVGTVLNKLASAVDGQGYRESGDEFVVLVPVDRFEEFDRAASDLLQSIDVQIDDKKTTVSVSTGYSMPDPTADFPTRKQRADAACEAAKREGSTRPKKWTAEVEQYEGYKHRYRCHDCGSRIEVTMLSKARPSICPLCATLEN